MVTNPPFSLFRESVAQLVKYEKKFLIIGNMNAITYRPKSVIRPPIWVYPYLLTGDERSLSIRAFSPAMAQAAYERQQGICPHCGKHFEIGEMEADHITPWHADGRTVASNCQMLCRECNRSKPGT